MPRLATNTTARVFANTAHLFMSRTTSDYYRQRIAVLQACDEKAQHLYEHFYLTLGAVDQARERESLARRLARCEQDGKFGEYFQVQSRYKMRVDDLERTRARLGVDK